MYLWKSAICAGCGACDHYYGLRYNPQLAFYCATCKDILHSFLREYRNCHLNISVEQRINDKIKFSWSYDGGFCVESINQETTVKIMQQFMDYVKSAPHGIVCYQSRGIWLGSDYPTNMVINYSNLPSRYSSGMMLTIYSPLDIQPTEDSVATLTWTIVRKVRIGQLDLDDTVISDIDKHVFDEHNAIIAVRYLFRE